MGVKIISENSAKEKLCVFSIRALLEKEVYCAGSECMYWQTILDVHESDAIRRRSGSGPGAQGYCYELVRTENNA